MVLLIVATIALIDLLVHDFMIEIASNLPPPDAVGARVAIAHPAQLRNSLLLACLTMLLTCIIRTAFAASTQLEHSRLRESVLLTQFSRVASFNSPTARKPVSDLKRFCLAPWCCQRFLATERWHSANYVRFMRIPISVIVNAMLDV